MGSSKRRGSLVCLYAANAMVYAFNALFYCFLPIYFNALFPPEKAGIILSIGPAVSLISPMLWGLLADRARYKNNVLILSILSSAVFFFMLKIKLSFLPMCILVGVVMLFMAPIAAIIDAITLEYSETAHIGYGPIRVMGTLGFGVISLISSLFTGKTINVIFYIFVGMAVVCSVTLLFCPQIKGHARVDKSVPKEETKKNADIRSLVCNKRLISITAYMIILMFAYRFYCNFYSTYLTGSTADGNLGLPQWIWGFSVLLIVLGEIPFFFFYNKLFDKFGIKVLLGVALIGSLLRNLLLGIFPSAVPILIVNVLTGYLITVATYCGSMYITRYIAPGLQATGQNFLYTIGQNIPSVLAGAIGGVMNAKLGTQGSMLLFAAITGGFTVFFFLVTARDKSPEFAPLMGKHIKK